MVLLVLSGVSDARMSPGLALGTSTRASTAHMHHGPRGALTQRRLYSQTHYFLQIHANGLVNGTRNRASKYGLFNFIDVGVAMVYIQGVTTGRYLCMNQNGRLHGSLKRSDECIFRYQYEKHRYNTYYSYKHSVRRRKWYVALSKRGKPRRGFKSRRRSKANRFSVMKPY